MAILNLIKNDPFLVPYEKTITYRYGNTKLRLLDITKHKGQLKDYINGHLFYGLHRSEDSWLLREWAPNAQAIHLICDNNNWKENNDYAFSKLENGNWELKLPLNKLQHKDLYKLLISWGEDNHERIPAYCRRVVQDEETKIFSAQVWEPPRRYQWKNQPPGEIKNPLIYEAHIGMATEEYKVGSYKEFTKNVLPRISDLGYNTIQLMAIQEHPYYGSFGYQVSNFFAPSSRFGTPEELMELIDCAHGLGIAVILDIVHSHAVKNEIEGLAKFDGTDFQYFHAGEKGDHPIWDSRCFNYGRDEVIHFLLANCKYWLEEFQFDGFRFDGVTSMIYTHHGLGTDFVDYSMYYDGSQDEDALTYLTLANILTHEINPFAITVAEDVSGMPGIASPYEDGGYGFDYRMSMGVADYWIKIIKETKDEDWHVGDIFYQLTNKRKDERTISYAESHDQAMVGDKSIIFRLIDKEMYTSMSINNESLIVDRGIALHKMIRLVSIATAGDGYLNFMGNEFGHPEWIDFPREGNNWGYHYARRQWKLADDENLKYRYLGLFDASMISLIKENETLSYIPNVMVQNIPDQVLIFERGSLIFVFNFNPETSFTDYGFEVSPGKYSIVLNTDSSEFGGFDRNDDSVIHHTSAESGKNIIKLYLPGRSAMVLRNLKK